MSSNARCTGRHQGPDIDGLIPGSVGAAQHAALPDICASVQRSWLQAYQRNDEPLKAKGIIHFSHSLTAYHLVYSHISLDSIGTFVCKPGLNSPHIY